MVAPESESDEENELLKIGLRMQRGEEVSLQDQLLFLHSREKDLSAQLTGGDIEAHHPLEHIRGKIKAINKQITGSGGTGGTTGKSSRRDAHNTPH